MCFIVLVVVEGWIIMHHPSLLISLHLTLRSEDGEKLYMATHVRTLSQLHAICQTSGCLSFTRGWMFATDHSIRSVFDIQILHLSDQYGAGKACQRTSE